MRDLAYVLAMLVCATTALAQSQGQQDIPLRRDVKIIYTSNIGAPDLPEMFSRNDERDYDWSLLRRYIHGMKFYQSHLWPNPVGEMARSVQGNTLNVLENHGAFRSVHQRYEMDTSIEVGAIKPHNCFYTRPDYQYSVDDVSNIVVRTYAAGGSVSSLAVDTPMSNCGYTPSEAAKIMGTWMIDVHKETSRKLQDIARRTPGMVIQPMVFGIIEPYPHRRIEEHLLSLAKIRQYLVSQKDADNNSFEWLLKYYDFDIDLPQAEKEGVRLGDDFKALLAFCNPLGIDVGVIINGEDPKTLSEDNEDYYARSVVYRLAKFKSLGLLDTADRIVIQSWYHGISQPGQLGLAMIPRNLPETSSNTGTSLGVFAIKCIANMVGDCSVYP